MGDAEGDEPGSPPARHSGCRRECVVAEEDPEELPVSIDLLRKPVDRDDLARILRRNLSRDSGRILVVGDNPDTSARLQRYLREAGLVVYTAEDGDSALAFLHRSEVDLVLLDLLVSGTDVFTALREIRSQPHDRTLPVVVLTATDLSGEVRDELSQWTNDIILKGPDVEARLRSVLDQYFGCGDQEAEGA